MRIRSTDDDGNATPGQLPLMTQADVDASVGSWVALIGYPAQSPFNDLADQQRIFDGIYNVKRVAPGTVMSVSPDGLLNHDATTLGGNSGSVVMDMATGQASPCTSAGSRETATSPCRRPSSQTGWQPTSDDGCEHERLGRDHRRLVDG